MKVSDKNENMLKNNNKYKMNLLYRFGINLIIGGLTGISIGFVIIKSNLLLSKNMFIPAVIAAYVIPANSMVMIEYSLSEKE